MAQVWTRQATKRAARIQRQAVAKHETSMSSGDAEFEEESWLESEAQIARFLGDFAVEFDSIVVD